MTDESATEEVGSALGPLADGGWMNIPGATKAIFRLVTSAGNVGAEWIEVGGAKAQQMKELIASDTEAKKAINAALSKVAAEMAIDDPAIVERSMRRWIGEEAKKQQNREGVAKNAAEELEKDPPPADTAGPSDDWLNHFGPYAEKATSEDVRALWGRVLAGEIRTPGSISLMTLQFLSVLDAETASLIETVLPYVVNGNFIPGDASNAIGLAQGYLINAGALAFGNYGSGLLNRVLKVDAENRLFLQNGPLGIVLTFSGADPEIRIGALLLSTVGQQVFRIIPSANRLHDMAPHFWKLEPKPIRIQKGLAVPSDGGVVQYLLLHDVVDPDAPVGEPTGES